MSKSKLTLIVDGNWLMMSRLSVINNRYVDLKSSLHDLKLLLIKSINVVLRTFSDIDNIIFVTDGGSWRKYEDIPECLHHDLNGELVEYKGTRVKTDDIDWDMIFGSFDEFVSVLGENGINVCSEHHVEGDDWCWYWSKKLNKNGTNVMLWSKDRDLTQLVHTDPTSKCFTVWWNKDNGVFTEQLNTDETDELTWLFNLESKENDRILTNILNKVHKKTYINPYEIVVDKIFMGDMSDNIFPLLLRRARDINNTKKFRINKKDLKLDIDINDNDAVRDYINSFYSMNNYSSRLINDANDEYEHFLYNKKLVWLNESSYPHEILEQMQKYDITNISKDCSVAESVIQAEAQNMNDLLETI